MPKRVTLAALVAEQDSSLYEAIGPFPALLDGDHGVVVQCALERVAVVRDGGDPEVIRLDRLTVDRRAVRFRVRLDLSRTGRAKAEKAERK